MSSPSCVPRSMPSMQKIMRRSTSMRLDPWPRRGQLTCVPGPSTKKIYDAPILLRPDPRLARVPARSVVPRVRYDLQHKKNGDAINVRSLGTCATCQPTDDFRMADPQQKKNIRRLNIAATGLTQLVSSAILCSALPSMQKCETLNVNAPGP
jgi:hypothetical protein